MNFEKFIASLYMSALMQLGMAAPEGGKPHVDLMGARQTIDIIGLLQEKTKGNLTPQRRNHAAERASTSCAWPTWK